MLNTTNNNNIESLINNNNYNSCNLIYLYYLECTILFSHISIYCKETLKLV